ncbi:hypothetical protein HY632_01335 [Candidatus Uhrbacteria bacterium]|nr:hypothetical protein [Candidatus Uhrbacteria bacterium]
MSRAQHASNRPPRRRRPPPARIEVMVGMREELSFDTTASPSVAEQFIQRADTIVRRLDAWLVQEGLRATVDRMEAVPMAGAAYLVISPSLRDRLVVAFSDFIVEGSGSPVHAFVRGR